ncbi:tetratricopeptide repeat protein [Amycolatopsis sp. TRM77291]
MEQLSGTLNPGDRLVGNRYVMKLTSFPPEGTSPWGGMSGAAMLCDGLLAGVVTTDPADRSHAALEAVPVSLLLRNPSFVATIHAHTDATEPRCAAIELWPLADAQTRALTGRPALSPAGLLPARRAVVPFHGREDLLVDLCDWVRMPGVGVWLLHGQAGQGKTRLAHQFDEYLTREGWTTLWLDPRIPAEQLPVLADVRVPALVVVDYAESRTTQLAAIADVLARRDSSAPVKLLLLARTAGAWWTDTLAAAGDTVRDLIDAARVVPLPVLDDPATNMQDSYRAAVTAFAAALSRASSHEHSSWEATAATLASRPAPNTGGQTVLAVQMTALADLLDNAAPTTGPADEPRKQGPEDRLLDHERGYWAVTAQAHQLGVGLATLADVVAAVTLLGPTNTDELTGVLARVPAVADLPLDRRDAVRGWLLHLYPGGEKGGFAGLAPDRLAERLIGRLLLDTTRPCIVEVVAAQATEPEAEQLLTVATRAAAHSTLDSRVGDMITALCLRHPALLVSALRAAPRIEQPRPLLRALDQLAKDPAANITILQRLSDALPQRTEMLADTAVSIEQTLVGKYRQALVGDSHQDGNHLAKSLNNLSIRLRNIGRREESLTASSEAVELYRQLAEKRPETFLTNLANSLINLSIHLGGAGHRKEGVYASREAVTIQRHLAEQCPDTFQPDLADSLNHLSNRLSDVNRHEEVLTVRREAVELYRQLTKERPDTFLPDLALTLDNLSIDLGHLGRLDEALAASSEAVEMYRRLTEQRPDTFLTDLAEGLKNFSKRLSDVGRIDEALPAINEAIDINRQLAEKRPDTFLRDLAYGLIDLSNRLCALGRNEEALTAISEAVDIQRRLADQRSDNSPPGLGSSLHSLSLVLGALDRRAEGLIAIGEAVDIRRRLARQRPAAHQKKLEESLRVVDWLNNL